MITHGNKQISEIVYARKASEGGGAVRLTNIIRGAQVVFGGMIPSLAWQLKPAAKSAILAAFGQTDGKAVIKATNAYLNALAATDPTKASALAGFINEDPMLVCSLGLQPQGVQMPIRWLYAPDGNVYVNTGVTVNSTDKFYVTYKYDRYIANYSGLIYGAYDMNAGIDYHSRYYVAVANSSNLSRYNYDENIENIKSFAFGRPHNIIDEGGKFYVDGNLIVNINSKVFTCTGPFLLFSTGWTHIPERSKGVSISSARINNTHHFIPFKSATREGMVDLVNATFYSNQGTGHFTDAYTLQDGVTPWTPLNQTP